MAEYAKVCLYKNETTGWKCPYEALDDSKEDFCIFHEKRKDKDIKKFNEGIKRILEDRASDAYHFEGFFFPAYFVLSGFEFNKNVFFSNAVFLDKVSFNKTKFIGDFNDFSGTKFLGTLNEFIKTIFIGEKTIFDLAEFSGETTFKETSFLGMEVDFKGIHFSQNIESISFGGTVFESKTNFTLVDLRKFFFFSVDLKNVDFSLIDWSWNYRIYNERDIPKIPVLKSFLYNAASEVYGQLKVKFHNKRDFSKAGMFHFREQECKRKSLNPFSFSWDFLNWIFLWILKVSCGYGEKLRNVGLSAIALVLIFGCIYMFLGLHNTEQKESLLFQYSLNTFTTTSLSTILKDFWTSFIFSIKGFFPLWRFQQYKVVGDFANLVAGIEFLLGAFMVGLFVYVFRRRIEK